MASACFLLSFISKNLIYRTLLPARNALAVEFVFCKKSDCRAGLSEDVLYTDFLHWNRAFLCQCIADCASKSSDHGVLFYGYDFAGLFCCCNDQLLIQRFDGVDVDDLGINAVCGKFLCCFQSGAYAKACCNDGDILAFTENNAFSEFKFVIRLSLITGTARRPKRR